MDDDRKSNHDADYQQQGTRWIWFLVRSGLEGRCRLVSPDIWRSLTGGKTWRANFWEEEKPKRHSHYRHPQVLIYNLGNNQELEIIGVHLKSKINKKPLETDAAGNLTGTYLREALEARIKLATEARNIREYIAAKFAS